VKNLKKTLILSLLVVALISFGIKGQAYALLDLTGLGGFGSTVIAPAAATIDVLGTGDSLRTQGVVDYAVLYNGSLYSYFYQVTNIGGGLNQPLTRFTVDNPYSFSLIGSGVITDSKDPVFLTDDVSSYGAFLDSPLLGGNNLQVGQATNRFYFQFNEKPALVQGNLIDGGIGSGSVPGPVPEPSSMMLLGMGVLGLLGFKRKIS
jgi:hypothetical protein